MRIRTVLLFACCACLLHAPAEAQNTGGVFGPIVNADHRLAEYRLGYDPDSGQTAQRLHYQQSIDGQRMWRAVVQARETADSSFDFDYVQGELFWQLTADDKPWQQGLRFDLRVRDSGRPGTVGVNWMHQFPVSDIWRARLLLLTSADFGDNSRDGIFLQTRAQLARSIADGRQYGLEMFSAYGALDDIADLDEQRHQLGPFFVTPIAGGIQLYANALFGVTDAAADVNLGLWLSKPF